MKELLEKFVGGMVARKQPFMYSLSCLTQARRTIMHLDSTAVWSDLQAIREQSPLIHNITNYVVMEPTANALLAIGASPVMTHAEEEIEAMTKISKAVVLNMGTLDPSWEKRAQLALQVAHDHHIPVIFDPVGGGATPYRTQIAQSLVSRGSLQVIRGNASEIACLCEEEGLTKGVDSTLESSEGLQYAPKLAHKIDGVVVSSGRVDVITDGRRTVLIHNGHPMMSKVTGMGCIASTIVAAFMAINSNAVFAAAHAMALMGIAGELAEQQANGPGSFRSAFTDSLHNLTLKDIHKRIQSDIL